ncbi:MAG: agmatine deiminase family protein [Candidatus Omnitrophica bacterium]|nr:agmatine deiminase family protein [Candidatus Omnitrophota bacterium]
MIHRQIKEIPFPDFSQDNVRMPAEWEPHRGTWVSCPHNPRSFSIMLDTAQDAFTQMIRALAEGEMVHINVNDAEMEQKLRARLRRYGVLKNVTIHHFPTNDAWCRDHGAIFVKDYTTGEIIATDWIFNAWGGKYPSELDNLIASKMAETLDCTSYYIPMVLEGGSIDVNGQGLLLTTEQCLLNENRNPYLQRHEIEEILCAVLGIKKILWLAAGIVGDDTDGHVDDIARFVDTSTIVAVLEEDKKDVNYAVLHENHERLKRFTDLKGNLFKIVPLPLPDPVVYENSPLPASYANFYIGNDVVLMPTFKCDQDKKARSILEELFPTRKIVEIPARDIVIGRGTCHCLTQQIPC